MQTNVKELESISGALAAALLEIHIKTYMDDMLLPSAHRIMWAAIAKVAEGQVEAWVMDGLRVRDRNRNGGDAFGSVHESPPRRGRKYLSGLLRPEARHTLYGPQTVLPVRRAHPASRSQLPIQFRFVIGVR